jgi:hypothetical protein
MKQELRLNYNSAKFRICVDDVKNSVVSGRVFSQRLKDVIEFHDLTGLVLRLDRLMDEQKYPQAFQRKRRFKLSSERASKPAVAPGGIFDDERPYMGDEIVAGAAGAKATFVLQIVTRQNTNWQGFVDLLDDAGIKEFKSELELLEMINDFLSLGGAES